MSKPPKELVEQWYSEAVRKFDLHDHDAIATEYVANKAAVWATEQALRKAAAICDRLGHAPDHAGNSYVRRRELLAASAQFWLGTKEQQMSLCNNPAGCGCDPDKRHECPYGKTAPHEMLPEGESTAKWAFRSTGFMGSLEQLTRCARCGEYPKFKTRDQPMHWRGVGEPSLHFICDPCHDALPE